MVALKIIMKSFICQILIFSITFSPVAFSQTTGSQSTEAQNTESHCEENPNEDGTPGIYKVGCEFNNDLAKTDLKDHYAEGVKGIIEQFVGAAFALVGVSLYFMPKEDASLMCPINNGAPVTYKIVQAGSLAYLLGEIAANSDFKKASKIAVDKNFQNKKNENSSDEKNAKNNKDINNKQIAAYDALIKIYKYQVSGLKKKMMMASLAEVAFISALGYEIYNIMGMNKMCSTTKATLTAETKAYEAALTALEKASIAASATPATAQCGATAAAINSYLINLHTQAQLIRAESVAQAAKKAGLSSKDQVALSSFWSDLVAFQQSLSDKVLPESKESEILDDIRQGATNTAVATKIKASRKALATTIAGTGCPNVGAVMAQVNLLEAAHAKPLYCCGVPVKDYPNLDNTNLEVPFPQDVIDNKTIAPKVGKNEYLKSMIENTLYRIAFNKVQKTNEVPQRALREFKNISQYVTMIMDQNNKLIKEDHHYIAYKKMMKNKNANAEDIFFSFMNKVQNEILIKSAHASPFSSLLNIGVKVGVMYYLLNDYLHKYAFPRPKNRAWTWGVMSGLNAVILSFDSKSKKEAQKRLDRVTAEKERFLNSHAEKTEISENNGGSNGKLNLKRPELSYGELGDGQIIMGCASVKNNGYAPATCPSVIPRSEFSFPVSKKRTLSMSNPLSQSLPLISNSAHNVATKGFSPGNLKTIQGNIKNASSIKPALSQYVQNLVDDFDKVDSQKSKKLNNKKSVKLKSSFAKFRKLFNGKNSASDVGSGSLALNPKSEKLGKEKSDVKSSVAAVSGLSQKPIFSNTPSSNSLDFDLDDNSIDIEKGLAESKDQSEFDEFIVDKEEINPNKDVSIFKLISNRYLFSYPVLLEQKKK